MLIGIVGPTGSGKGVAADFLAQRIPGATVKPIGEFPDILPPGEDNCGVVIIPDVVRKCDAAQIRRHGKIIHMYGRAGRGRGRFPTSVDIEIADRDFLIGNHAGMPELYKSLSDIVREINRGLK